MVKLIMVGENHNLVDKRIGLAIAKRTNGARTIILAEGDWSINIRSNSTSKPKIPSNIFDRYFASSPLFKEADQIKYMVEYSDQHGLEIIKNSDIRALEPKLSNAIMMIFPDLAHPTASPTYADAVEYAAKLISPAQEKNLDSVLWISKQVLSDWSAADVPVLPHLVRIVEMQLRLITNTISICENLLVLHSKVKAEDVSEGLTARRELMGVYGRSLDQLSYLRSSLQAEHIRYWLNYAGAHGYETIATITGANHVSQIICELAKNKETVQPEVIFMNGT